jgi:hypothetical protein
MKRDILPFDHIQQSDDLAKIDQIQNVVKHAFPKGKKRFVHVNRQALEHNQRKGTNYPTLIVIEDGKKFEFHAVQSSGLLCNFECSPLEAKVFMVTFDKITGYLDKTAPPSFAFVVKERKWQRKFQKIFLKTKHCLTFFKR